MATFRPSLSTAARRTKSEDASASVKLPLLDIVFAPGGPYLWRTLILGLVITSSLSYTRMISGEFLFNQFNHDDTESYIALGDSLAHGRGYTRSLDPNHYIAHQHFPPGLPLLLAPCFLISSSFVLPQLLIVGFSLANLLLFWLLARRCLPDWLAFAATAILVFSPVYDQLATVIMAEQVALTFLLLSLLLLEKWLDGGQRFDKWCLWASLSLGFGILVKPILLVIVAAVAGSAFPLRKAQSERRTRVLPTMVLLISALLPFLAWTIRGQFIHAPGYEGLSHVTEILKVNPYGGHYVTPGEFAARIMATVKWALPASLLDAFGGLPWLLESYLGIELPLALRIGTLLLFATLLGRALRRGVNGRELVPYAALALSVTFLVFPGGGQPRYWLLVSPLLLILTFCEISILLRKYAGSRLAAVTLKTLVIALVLIPGGCLVLDHLWRQPQRDLAWEGFVEACREARVRLPTDSVILSHHIIAAQWISGRRAPLLIWDNGSTTGRPDGNRPLFLLAPTAAALKGYNWEVKVPEHYRLGVAAYQNEFYRIWRLLPNGS